MSRLIVNAEDLGLHPRIDEGIFLARARGIVRSASLLVTGRFAKSAIQRAKEEELKLGLHLALTSHLTPTAPFKEIRWLAPGGRFRKTWTELATAWLARLIPPEEVALEFRCQLDRARELGAQIDHLDTHQHLHLLPGLTELVDALAEEEGLPVRWMQEPPSAHWLMHPRSAIRAALASSLSRAHLPSARHPVRALGLFEKGRLSERRLLRLVRALPQGDFELICHPGLNPGQVKEAPGWELAWETELAALTSKQVMAAIEARGIELTTYAGVGLHR